MAPVPDPSSSTQTATDALAEEFGANDWLLEEMYEQYVADPGSVDPSWAQYFKTHQLGGTANGSTGNGAPGKAHHGGPRPPLPRRPPPRLRQAKPHREDRDASREAPAKPGCRPSRAPRPDRRRAPEKPAPAAPAAKRPATVERPTTTRTPGRPPPATAVACPADPPNPANRPNVDLEEPVRTVLRGAPARTAKNMDASLTVPTATSVRSLPVKLLIDQRVVINNHLRRARGGKVSYTHLIGFAMVQALKTHPAMNNGYEVDRRQADDGRAAAHQPRPGHRHAQARRHPAAAGAEHQELREPRLRPVLGGVRGDRQEGAVQLADRRGLPGHDHHADQPGDHRHQPLGAPADERPGRHHRRRLDGLPAGVPGLRSRTSSR